MSEVLCTICARGGSKGVKNKNTRELLAKPLIAHTIEQAKESKLFEHIVVSTDSDEIASVSKQYGAEVFFKREAHLATDKAAKTPVIRDAFLRSQKHFNKAFKYLIDLDATAPLREAQDIVNAYEKFIKFNYDTLITGVNARRSPYFNLVELTTDKKVRLSKTDKQIFCRQDSPKCFDMNASIYIYKKDALLENDTCLLENTGLYEMREETLFDIDSELDFKIVELLMKEKNAKR